MRAADGGTLFLDEIGDLPSSSQVALLRVLQEPEVTPLGATHPIKVDLRVICATNRDLEAQVALGQFRADLYAAVRPPLRPPAASRSARGSRPARRGPAPSRRARSRGPVRPRGVRALYQYHWPLNVRELETSLMSALVLVRGGEIDLEHLPAAIVASPGDSTAHGDLIPRDDPSAARAAAPCAPAAARHGDDIAIELQQIRDALDRCGGNQSRAARLLGVSRNTLIARIERYGLARPLTPRR